MELVLPEFSLERPYISSRRGGCAPYHEEPVEVPAGLKFLGTAEATGTKQKFLFKGKPGRYIVAFKTFTDLSRDGDPNWHTGERKTTVYVRKEDKTVIKILPISELTTEKTWKEKGVVVKQKKSVELYGGLELNGVKFAPLPEDFEDLLKELKGSSLGLQVNTLNRELQMAGLMDHSPGSGDFGTKELKNNYDAILNAYRQVRAAEKRAQSVAKIVDGDE